FSQRCIALIHELRFFGPSCSIAFCTSCFIVPDSSFSRNGALRDLPARDSLVQKPADLVFRMRVSAPFIADESGLWGFGKCFFIFPESSACNDLAPLIFPESRICDLALSVRCDRKESGL